MRGTKRFLGGVGLLLLVVAMTSEARAQGLGYVGPFGLFHTNGNKVVVGSGNVLHMAYQESGAVKYTTSTDGGVTWAVPFTVSPPSGIHIHPTIAVNGTTVAIAWVQQTQPDQTGTLFYRVRNGTWSLVTQVSCVSCAYKPSMVNLGSKIHLAWSASSSVQYATFPITPPPSMPLAPVAPGGDVTQTIYGGLCCQRYKFFDVSVAVAPPCVISPPRFELVSTPAIVQVATSYVENDTFDSLYSFPNVVYPPPYILGSGVFVFRNDPTKVIPWFSVYANGRNKCFDPLGVARSYPGGGTTSNITACSNATPGDTLAISASLSAAPALSTTGDFFLAWSDVFDNVNRTTLTHMNGGPPGVWANPSIDLSSLSGNVDVINRLPPLNIAAENFRVAWSEKVEPPPYYGPVKFCSGNWTGSSASPAPLSCIPVDQLGRDPQALYHQASGQQTRAMFDRQVSLGPTSFALTPYQVTAANTAIYQFGVCDKVPKTHTFVVSATLASLGDLLADDRIAAPIRVSLLSKLKAADAALAAGRRVAAARQLGALANRVAAQGGKTIPAELAAATARAIGQRVAALTGAPALAIVNLHDQQTVQFLAKTSVSLATARTASERTRLPFPLVAVIARNTGRFDLLRVPACPTCGPQLAPDAHLDIGGMPAAAAGPLAGGDGDDYWFIVTLAPAVTPMRLPALVPIAALLTYDSVGRGARRVTLSDTVTVDLEP